MKNYEGRNIDLKRRINCHLTKLTGVEEEYFSKMTNSDLIELKTMLADIHNVLTFKMTIAAAHWLCYFFHISLKIKNKL